MISSQSDFIIVILPQSEGLGTTALGIVLWTCLVCAIFSQCFNLNNAIVQCGWLKGPGSIMSLECPKLCNHFVTKSLATKQSGM